MELRGGVDTTISDLFYYKRSNKIPVLVSGVLVISPRVGLSLFLAEHHRIEFVTKIPVYSLIGYGLAGQDGLSKANFYKPIQFMLGYKFVF